MQLTTTRRGPDSPRPAAYGLSGGAPSLARKTLALVPLCALVPLILLTALSGTARAEPAGSISGTVTEASSGAPLRGIEVCAYEPELVGEEEEEGRPFGCAKTEAHGHYTISELIAEEGYEVVFEVPAGSKLNFVTQYYDGVLPPAEPTPVTIAPGKTTSGIDAALAPGAQISGTVKDAATGAPLEGAAVYALRTIAGESSLEVLSYGHTGAHGEYLLAGLPSGAYEVLFVAPGYAVQYYRGVAAETEASAVAVTAPRVSDHIDAALYPGTPVPPTLVFEPSLATPPGSHSGGPGAMMPGATSPPGTGRLSLSGRHIAVRSDGLALVKVLCAQQASCRARMTLETARSAAAKGSPAKGSGAKGSGVKGSGAKGEAPRREVAIGKSAAVSVAAGQRAMVRIKLNGAGLAALIAHHWRLSAELALAGAGSTQDTRVLLTAATQGSEAIFTRVPVIPLPTPGG